MSSAGKPDDGIVDAEFEVAGDATRNLGAGQSLIVAEVNAIRSMAVAKPRDEMAIAQKITTTLKNLPGMAVKLKYCKPVGWKTYATCECGRTYEAGGWQIFWDNVAKAKACPACGAKRIKQLRHEQQFARGLSVKAAEYLATEIMYCRTDVGVEKIDDNLFRVTAKFFDVQTGRYNSREAFVSRLKKKWGGGFEREDDERFFGLTIPSAQSKILREMVNRAVPFVIRHTLEEVVEEMCDISLTAEEIAKIVAGFKRFDVTVEDLEKLLNCKQEHWTQDNQKRCREMFSSLKNNELNREELLAAATAGFDDNQATGTANATATPDATKSQTVTGADLEAAGKRPKDATPTTASDTKTPASGKPAAAGGNNKDGLFANGEPGDGKGTSKSGK